MNGEAFALSTSLFFFLLGFIFRCAREALIHLHKFFKRYTVHERALYFKSTFFYFFVGVFFLVCLV